MARLIESLESRTLFASAGATAVLALKADERKSKSDLEHLASAIVTGLRPLLADFVAAKTLTMNAKRVGILKKESSSDLLLLREDLAIVEVAIARSVNTLVAQGNLSKRLPNNTKLAAKVATDAMNLTTSGTNVVMGLSTALQKYTSDLSTSLTDLSNSNMSNTKFENDLATSENAIQVPITAFATDASSAFTTDVASIVAAY